MAMGIIKGEKTLTVKWQMAENRVRDISQKLTVLILHNLKDRSNS